MDDLEVNRTFLEKLALTIPDIDTVRTFSAAAPALHSFLDVRPDLVITDFSMPLMDAAAFLQRLRSIPGLEETPVIVISANEKVENRRKALLCGATDFLTTPFDALEFQLRVRNLLRLGLHQKFLRTNSLSLKQKLTETRLRSIRANQARREEFMSVIDSLPALIFAVRNGSECVFANQYCFEFLGGPAEPRFRALISKLSCFPEPAEVPVRNKRGEEYTFLFMRRLVSHASPTRDFVVYSGIDVSTLKQTEASLREAKLQAEAANRAKSAFLANMSHEIRTPLNAIIGFSEIICSETLGPLQNPKYREYIKDIFESSSHLLSIINEILDFSQVERGHYTLSVSEFSLADCVAGVCKMLAPELRSRHNQIEFQSKTNFKLRSDPQKFSQVLLNIITNSNRSMQGGRIHIEAAVNLEGGITVAVEDCGIGMTSAELRVAISEFGRIENPELTGAHRGIGLGLPLSSRFMKLLGGKLEISSEKGVGTRVELVLPAGAVVAPAPGIALKLSEATR